MLATLVLLFFVFVPLVLASNPLNQGTLNPVLPIPVYERGSTPNWFLPADARRNGLTFLGSHERLRIAVDKVLAWDTL